ncbi:uncharacterized protein LOC135138108 isoform X1 [Zophobas morio]|uniref:uncharacterized protein LOC135138108 isoform X1 n=1 Tax=Zophobas morio TaxID=2755281 RepID=UPI0030837A7D
MSPLLLLLVAVCVDGAPLARSPHDLEAIVEHFLENLYDKLHDKGGQDIYDQMQGDQPPDNNISPDLSRFLSVNFSAPTNMTDYFRATRDRHREVDLDVRARDNWVQALKENILLHIGRSNMTTSINENNPNAMNLTMIPQLFNSTLLDDGISEKIRSYYPSCDAPSNMDQDTWKNDNVMNLYFNNFHRSADEKGMSIATATLRLYRVPSENTTKVTGGKTPDCDSSSTSEEDKLLRVSIYWYSRSIRKKKVRRRLSDSKVIQENAKWVELSVKPATRDWSNGSNLSLAILVEDQDGNVLKADRLFKGALCMVGASTPKPIPTIIKDAALQSNSLDQRINSLLGRNSTASLSGDTSMLPTIDICTLDFPKNHPRPRIANLRTNACNLKKSHEHAQLLAERDKLERLATLPELLSPRHIRHQRQHLKLNDFDPRSKIVNKRILTKEELQALNITIDR